MQLAFHFEGNDLVLSFKIFYLVSDSPGLPSQQLYLKAVSEGVFLPGRSQSSHSPGAATGRGDEVAAKLSQTLGI